MENTILTRDFLTVKYKDKAIVLNINLIKKQGLENNIERIEQLKQSHIEKMMLFEQMKQTDDRIKLHELAGSVEQLEYHQQYLWGFPLNSNMHRWFEVPKCACPKQDNIDRMGTNYKIYDYNCPVHGKLPEVKKTWKQRIMSIFK